MTVNWGVSKRWLCLAVAAAAIASYARAECNESFYGDGDCDRQNNSEECSYDGGDCCSCTCESSERFSCEDTAFACIDPEAACVDDDDVTLGNVDCILTLFGDSICDDANNSETCGYDGGDCCPCTCEDESRCGEERGFGGSGFDCVDPSADCEEEEDDNTSVDDGTGCNDDAVGDSMCDEENNNEACGYDGGDCCICTCFVSPTRACGEDGKYDCVDPSASCSAADGDGDSGSEGSSGDMTTSDDDDDDEEEEEEEEEKEDDDNEAVPLDEGGDDDDEGDESSSDADAVEVATKTGVSVTATAYDWRAGRSSEDVGCGVAGDGGCLPALSRDGVTSEIESRWSCATKIVEGGGPCEIEFVFDEPQDIVDIEVAFWKGDQRTRTLEVKLNGEVTHTHESYAKSTFNTLGVEADDVTTVTLGSIFLEPDEWISLLEVVIMVKP